MERKMSFADRVYALCKRIPAGKVSTYGAIAKALNSSPRAVGQALRCNPYAPVIPCHRIIYANGFVGYYNKGIAIKINLLKVEGIKININGKIDIERYLWRFK